MVKEIPGLNLLGRGAIKALSITVDKFFFLRALASLSADSDWDLQNDCLKLRNNLGLCSSRIWVIYATWSWKSSSNLNPNQSS